MRHWRMRLVADALIRVTADARGAYWVRVKVHVRRMRGGPALGGWDTKRALYEGGLLGG